MRRSLPSLLLAAFAVSLASCGKSDAEYHRLLEENERLRMEIEQFKLKLSDKAPDKATDVRSEKPDLDLNIIELWTQRFDDTNAYRAKQMLSDKVIRLTGLIQVVPHNASEAGIVLTGASKRYQNMRLTVNFDSAYAAKVRDGMASLDPGMTITVQGKFLFERMGMTAAEFVDRATGKALTSDDLAALARKTR